MTDLLALADRVEALTGPSREVDALIAQALGFPPNGYALEENRGSWTFFLRIYGREIGSWHAPKFSASLDAALSLVPEGERYELCNIGSDRPMAFVTAPGIDWDDGNCVGGANAAIALTCAALRARAAMETQP